MRLPIAVLYLFLGNLVPLDATSLDSETHISLPKLFYFNESETCPLGNIYCHYELNLRLKDDKNPSKLWRRIEEIRDKEPFRFYYGELFRGICLKGRNLQSELNESFGNGIIPVVVDSHCFKIQAAFEVIGLWDVTLVSAIVIYITYVLYCTVKIYRMNEDSRKNANKLIRIFSVVEVWKLFREPIKSEGYNALEFTQGMRAILTIFVIISHHIVGILNTFTDNREFLENIIPAEPFGIYIISAIILSVQSFFVLSGWLLAMKLQKIVQQNGKITMKDVVVIAANRYLRLIPLSMLTAALFTSNVLSLVRHPVYESLLQFERHKCSTGWWRNLLFIQNWTNYSDRICAIHTWYLAADTQMYFLVLILFYLSFKSKISMNYFLGTIVAIAVSIQGHNVLTTDYDGLLRPYLRDSLMGKHAATPVMIYSYMSTVSNVGSFVVGYFYGIYYTKNKTRNIFDTPAKKFFWYLVILTSTVLLPMIYYMRFSRPVEVVMATTIRPFYSFIFGLAVLGMATNTGGIMKKFFGCQPLVFLGKLSYQTYLLHVAVLVLRVIVTNHKLVHFDYSYLIFGFFIDIIASFCVGLIMLIIFDVPFAAILQIKMKPSRKKVN